MLLGQQETLVIFLPCDIISNCGTLNCGTYDYAMLLTANAMSKVELLDQLVFISDLG